MKHTCGCLSGNALKIIALITMTIDHIGYILLPNVVWLRIVGRLAFPLFAYLISEGCKYTKNKSKYLLLMCALGIVCQIFTYFFVGQTKLNILLTFSASIGLIYLLQWVKNSIKTHNKKQAVLSIVLFVISIICTYCLTSNNLTFSPLNVDYGFWGIMVAVFVSIFDNGYAKLAMFALALLFVCISYMGLQWFCLPCILLVLCYNGQRGKHNIKYLFYAYYPLHLVILYLLSFIV